MYSVKLRKFVLQKYFDPSDVKGSISSYKFTTNSASSGIKMTGVLSVYFILQYAVKQTVCCTL
jgi:hypothetical protein